MPVAAAARLVGEHDTGLTATAVMAPAPRANAIAERWLRSVRTECLDHVFIFSEWHQQKVLAEYVGYFSHWRPHRSIGQLHPSRRGHARRIEATKLERSSQYQCLEAFITSMSTPHDLPDRFLRPTGSIAPIEFLRPTARSTPTCSRDTLYA
jgi:hypothetical protein